MSLITATIGGKTVYLPQKRTVNIVLFGKIHVMQEYQVPEVQGGTEGYMEEDELTKRIVFYEDENETWFAEEWWEDNQLRKRNCSLYLKQGLPLSSKEGDLGG